MVCVCVCVCVCVFQPFIASFHLRRASKFPIPSTQTLLYSGCLCCRRQRQQFTVTAWSTALFFVEREEKVFLFLFLCLCPLSNCALSGCGGNTEQPASKQNPNMCSLSVCFFLSLSLTPSPLLLFFTFHSFSFSSSHRTLSLALSFLPLSLPQPVAQLQQCLPGKSWLWYPWKTSQRVASGGRWGRWRASNSAHLLHSRHFGCLLWKENAALILYFSYCRQKVNNKFARLFSNFSLARPPPFRKFYASQMTIFITHPSWILVSTVASANSCLFTFPT